MGHVPKPEGCGETYQSCMDGMLRVMWKVFMVRGGAKWTFSDGCDMGDVT